MVETRLDIPKQALEAICRRYGVQELLLFGSVLRDDFRPESDIDLLVRFRPEARIGFLAFAGLQEELSDLLGPKVDLVPKDGLRPRIRDSILASARVIYGTAE